MNFYNTQIKSDNNRSVRRVRVFDLFSLAEYAWHDLTVAGKASDVCDVLHASRRDTYICMYASEHMCQQPIMHAFRREQSLKILYYVLSAFARTRDLFTGVDRIIVSRCIDISQL